MDIDVIILNYNGEDLFARCLPSLIQAKKCSRHNVNLHVIDNESTDGSLQRLKEFGAELQVIPHKNRFLCSFNDVVSGLKSDVVVLLNNDIKVDTQFIDPLAEVFLRQENVFLAAPKVCGFQAQEEGAYTRVKVNYGLFWSSALFEHWQKHVDSFSYTFSSGFGAFDRKKFLELGGYDDLFLPGRFEDVDLSLRAWKKGWRCYYQPKSIVYHLGQVAFKNRFGKSGIDAIDGRNIFLFMWKNYDRLLLARHLLLLPLWLAYWLCRRKLHYILGLRGAWKLRALIKNRRRQDASVAYRYSTSSIFKQLSSENGYIVRADH
jgi:N-acetylglucosaminyl-diphospho-decaprenol L-rhamnosyltransferase